MDLTLTTPALLFPAISLLLLAYTNRFLTLANLIRSLQSKYSENEDDRILSQIKNLRKRVILIKQMQLFGIWSLLLCVVCMFVLFAGLILVGKWIFGISLILLIISLAQSIREIQISVDSLHIQLSKMEGVTFSEGIGDKLKNIRK
jgi:hypothetical protein